MKDKKLDFYLGLAILCVIRKDRTLRFDIHRGENAFKAAQDSFDTFMKKGDYIGGFILCVDKESSHKLHIREWRYDDARQYINVE